MPYRVKAGDTPGKVAAALGIPLSEVMGYDDAFSTPGDARTLQIGYVFDGESAGADTSLTDYTTGEGTEETRFNGLPGQPEIWEIDGDAYVVYFAPDVEPPVPLLYTVPSDEDLKSFFGDSTP